MKRTPARRATVAGRGVLTRLPVDEGDSRVVTFTARCRPAVDPHDLLFLGRTRRNRRDLRNTHALGRGLRIFVGHVGSSELQLSTLLPPLRPPPRSRKGLPECRTEEAQVARQPSVAQRVQHEGLVHPPHLVLQHRDDSRPPLPPVHWERKHDVGDIQR